MCGFARGRHWAYTIPQLTKTFPVCRTTVYEEIKAGRLHSFTVGRRRLVSREAIETYMQARAAEEAARRGEAARRAIVAA